MMFYQICAAKSISHNSFLDLRVVSNSETESIVKQRLREMWQKNREDGMDVLWSTKKVGERCRHSAFNYTVLKRWKHNTRNWDSCGQIETMEDIILHCQKYEAYRQNLTTYLRKTKIPLDIMVVLKQNENISVRVMSCFRSLELGSLLIDLIAKIFILFDLCILRRSGMVDVLIHIPFQLVAVMHQLVVCQSTMKRPTRRRKA